MAESKQHPSTNWKQRLFMGVEIPIPWLIGIVAALLFNAGIIYTQFSELQKQTKEFVQFMRDSSTQYDKLERRVDRAFDRDTVQDAQIQDHEQRIRSMERRR